MKGITTVLLAGAHDVAWSMATARENGVMSPFTIVARFWERLGDMGETLAAMIDRCATALGIDMSTYMLDRAYQD